MDGGGGAAARHVGPPRTVDVQQFAAARASEVQLLYNALKAQQEEGASSLTTPRHLRRRTTSHNRRLPFRWRSNAAQAGAKKNNEKNRKDEGNLESSSTFPQGTVGPTAEGESSRKRRPEKRIPSRRVRRRIELQGVRAGTTSCMRDGTRRLATHVWHAKRFPMTKTWGYCLPQGLPGRGRGAKAVFKWVKEAAVLHDASYIGLIELQGTEDAILRIISQTLERPPGPLTSGSPCKEGEMHGLLYGNAVLHNVGKAPREAIAPVTILWRPSSSSEGVGTSELSTVGEGVREQRQLWIWVHPSAFDNALLALSTACERQGLEDLQNYVQCRSRRGDLARLDIFGRRALEVLRKVLRSIPRRLSHLSSSTDITQVSGHQDSNTHVTTTTPPDVSQSPSTRIFAKADCLPAAAVIALDVYDPRDIPRSFYSGTNAADDDKNLLSDSPSSSKDQMDEEAAVQDRKPPGDSIEDIPVTPWEKLADKRFSEEISDSPYLWSPQPNEKLAALSQKAFTEKRHKRRKAYLTGFDNDSVLSNLEERALDSRVEQSGACPIVLLKHAHSRLSASGWSIIMPITWVQAFWIPLVFAGGHVIGLRERHWLATDAGLPYFPHDFPDCPAHAEHVTIENAAFDCANQARPPSKRSQCFAVSPLQRSIMDAYRDHILNDARTTPAVASELIDEKHRGQSMEAKRTSPAGGIARLTDLDGDTAMTQAGCSVVRESVPPVSLIVASEFRNVDGDTDKAAIDDCTVSEEGCEVGREGNPPEPNFPLFNDSASLIDPLPDKVPSLQLCHRIDKEILPEFASPERDASSIGTGTMVSGSLVTAAAGQTMHGDVIPDLTVPLGSNYLKEVSPTVQDTFLSLPLQVVDGVSNSEFANPNGDTPCQVIDGALIPETSSHEGDTSASILKTDSGRTVDGVSVAELTKPLVPIPASEAESLPDTVSPLLVASDKQVAPKVTHSDRDSKMVATDTEVARSPSSEMVDKPAEGSLDFLPSRLCDYTFLGLNSNMKGTAASGTCPIFVARTVEALMKVFRENGLLKALLLCSSFMNSRSVLHSLRKGTLEWRASDDPEETKACTGNIKVHAMVGGHGKGCYLRVLIMVPRKGVLKEHGLLCYPTKEDFDAFLNRSQHWQGVETSWPNPGAKELKKIKRKRKERGKRKQLGEAARPPIQSHTEAEAFAERTTTTNLDLGDEDCCSREAIGCITSTGPQGSSWSGTGICEVSSLMKLRAMQWQDQRWWNKKEILVLAGNRLSPTLRPVLVSIVLEIGPEHDVVW